MECAENITLVERRASLAAEEAVFAALAACYRRELLAHCRRMLGSAEDAEDVVQETLLRAWRNRESFEGRSSFRAWLYRIATNACLDALARRSRPDRLPAPVPPAVVEPDAEVVSKETIDLTLLAAVRHLPPRQRAVLILRDLLGWSAKETASLLEGSVASANSALQRARATLREQLAEPRLEWPVSAAPCKD